MSVPPIPHAPLGAFASFHFGPPGAPAGFALPADAPVAQNVFVGCRSSTHEPWSLLPAFTCAEGGPQPLLKGRFGRFFAAAGDKWMIGPLVFKLCTPFDPAPVITDEAFAYAPVVCGYLEYDNTHHPEPAELIFGLGAEAAPLAGDALSGFAAGATHGFATAASPEVVLRRDEAVFGVAVGAAAALHFTVPAHAKRIYPLVVGFFEPGYHYTGCFGDLTAVLAHGIARHAEYIRLADTRDGEFMRSALAFDAKTNTAHALRTWLAQTRRRAGEAPVDLAPLRALWQAVTAG